MIYTFAGHWFAFDRDLKPRLDATLLAVISQYSHVEFLCAEKDPFSDLCVARLQKLSAFYDFQTTLVCAQPQALDDGKYDKICCPLPPTAVHFTVVRRRLDKWRLNAANGCICYLYPELGREEARMLQFLQNQKKQILQLTNPVTAAEITAQFAALGTREQFVLQSLHHGKTGKEIGAALGLSSARVFQIASRGRYQVMKALRQSVE